MSERLSGAPGSIDEKSNQLELRLSALQSTPHEFMSALEDELDNPANTLLERNKMSEVFWQAASHNPIYIDEIGQRLNADNQEFIAQAGHMLDVIRGSRDFAKHFSEDESQRIRLEGIIKDFAIRCREKNTGSYFLVKKADMLVSEMDGTPNRAGMDRGMFQISPTQWGAYNLDGLAISSDPRYLAQHRSGIAFDMSALSSLGNREVTPGDFADFAYLQSKVMRNEFTKDFHVELAHLHLPEQFQMLTFLKSKTATEMESVKEFSKRFGVAGMRTFLSLEYGKELGNKIIEYGNQKPKEAQAVFEKYAGLVSETEHIGELLQDSYGKNAESSEINRIKEAVLKKGRSLLEQYVTNLDKQTSADEVIRELGQIETGAVAFFLTFKTIKESGQLPPLEEIKGISFEQKLAGQISSEEKKSMVEMYKENYRDDPAFLETLLKKFEERFADPQTKFYLLKYKDKLKASIGFTPDPDRENALYGHSFNVETPLRGISIGNTMLERAKDIEAQTHTLTSDCAAYAAIASKNIETGYIGKKFYSYQDHPSLFVERNDRENGRYWGKQMVGQEAQLIAMAREGILPETVMIEIKDRQSDLDFNPLSRGYVLTRYFKYTPENKWVAVMERLSSLIH